MASLVNSPEHWRGRAKGARMLSAAMSDERSKELMQMVAKEYERMAERVEESLGVGRKRTGRSCRSPLDRE
jgi:hypothetical protein